MDKLEYKASLSVDDAGTVTGIAWPFGTPDRVGDVIEKGAFASPARLPMLFAHDQGQSIGVWDQITETAEGLHVKGRLLVDDVARAREVRALVREGAVGGLSIGFVTKAAKPRSGGGRTISALQLHEISIVAVPSHPGATITSMKAASDGPALKETHMENEDLAPDFSALETKLASVADEVKSFAKIGERLDKMELRLNRPRAANDNLPDPANDNAVERKALASFIRTGTELELKAAASDNDAAGGYFVLPTVDMTIRNLMTDLSPLRSLAEVVTISSDRYERFYALGKRGAQRVSERDDRPQDTPRPELIKHSYGVGEYYAAPAATRHLLDDASVDIAAWLIGNATHDFAETEAEDFLRYDGTNGFIVQPWFFCPGDRLRERADRDNVPYPQWAADGFITATPGPVVDYDYVEDRIRALCSEFNVQEVAFDPHMARQVQSHLLGDGIPCVDMRQGWVTMAPAIKELERAIIAGKLQHGGHPVLRWNFANIAVETDKAGNQTFHKGKSTDRIDGAQACAMAVGRKARRRTTCTPHGTSMILCPRTASTSRS